MKHRLSISLLCCTALYVPSSLDAHTGIDTLEHVEHVDTRMSTLGYGKEQKEKVLYRSIGRLALDDSSKDWRQREKCREAICRGGKNEVGFLIPEVQRNM